MCTVPFECSQNRTEDSTVKRSENLQDRIERWPRISLCKRKSIETRRHVGTKTNGVWQRDVQRNVHRGCKKRNGGIAGSLARVEGHSRVAVLCLFDWPRHLAAKHTCPTLRSNTLTTLETLFSYTSRWPRRCTVKMQYWLCVLETRTFAFSFRSPFITPFEKRSFHSHVSVWGIFRWTDRKKIESFYLNVFETLKRRDHVEL